ncbi:MAG TPA: wax ester/triacylglycerol synthase domain-containing protein, partial [Marmoricola sp.]|nr:wax ester/triacylglycerol synthase domain-containing protein [Marmoricola sp.]
MDAPLVRLSGFDAGFFYSQTPEVHQHIHVVALLDAERVGLRDGPREGHRGVLTFESFTAAVSSRLPLLPPLRHRTIRVPFALHHPVILPVLEIDTAHHFRHHDLGGAGTAENVRDLVSAIASSALDEHHPLWEMHYTEGLADGRVAVIVKLHHSLADGVAISALLEHIIATPAAFDPPQRLPEAVRVAPSRASLVREALRDLIIQLRIVPALVLRTARGMSAASRYQRVHRATVPGPLGSTPRVSFNGRLTARREFATASIPLARFRELRAQYQGQDDDVTLNDLVLGSVSGALRHWLEAHDEHPSKPLTVGIPISLDDLSLPR